MAVVTLNKTSWTLVTSAASEIYVKGGAVGFVASATEPPVDAEYEAIVQGYTIVDISPVLPLWGRSITGNTAKVGVVLITAAAAISGLVPVNTVAPSVSGPGIVPSTLTADVGTWSNSPTQYTYQWLRDGEVIAGASGATVSTTVEYDTVLADSGKSISILVAGVNASGTGLPVGSNEISIAVQSLGYAMNLSLAA